MGVGVESNHLIRGMNPDSSLFHTTPSQHHRTSRTAVTWRHTPPAQGSTGMDAWEGPRRNVLSCKGSRLRIRTSYPIGIEPNRLREDGPPRPPRTVTGHVSTDVPWIE